MYFMIVEDLGSDSRHLLRLIKEYYEARAGTVSASCYENAESFLEDYRPGVCNAIFLDILLKQSSGMQAAEKVREIDDKVPIVFTTSEKSFSFESYHVHALDFLMKPIRQSELLWCLDQITESLAVPLTLNVPEAHATGASERMIPLEQLIRVESIRNGVLIFTTLGEIRTSQRVSFAKIVQLLPKTGEFCVFSRGQLVNFAYVSEIGSKGEIRLNNGQLLYCSRRKIQEVLAAFAEYRFRQLRSRRVRS